MSKGSSLPYHLRTNKAVDRELFVDLLTHLAPTAQLRKYRYVGLGGPFLEDFRVLHARLGLEHMVCVEVDANTHCRQKFNQPLELVQCVHDDVDTYLRSYALAEEPSVVWLDMTAPSRLRADMDLFVYVARNAAAGSILRLTLNASPDSLGGTLAHGADAAATLHDHRLQQLKKRLGDYVPATATATDMTRANYGKLLLRCLQLALQEQLFESGQSHAGICAFQYRDGQPMVSATIIVAPENELEKFLETTHAREWEFYKERWFEPECIELPELSAKERIELERRLHDPAYAGVTAPLGFMFDDGDLVDGDQVLAMFRRYYRLYPHFSRVHL